MRKAEVTTAALLVEVGAVGDDAPLGTALDPELVGSVAETVDDDPNASFDAAFADLARLAYRVAYRILGSRGEAEDVAQETLTRAYLRWRRMHGYAEPWVARVAANLAIDAWRHQHRTAPTSSGSPVDLPEHQHTVVDRVDLVKLLRQLPRRQREVLVLRYLADQSEQATARTLGCSVGSVKRHAHRALVALRARTTEHPEP